MTTLANPVDARTDDPGALSSPRVPGGGARRLQSLDLLRGLTVAGMIVVNASDAVNLSGHPVFPVLLHAQWAGFTMADAVFPAFITMVGVSIAVSARPEAASHATTVKIAWRAVRLVLLGLFLANVFLLLDPAKLWPPRLTGVLQRIGVVYAIAAFAYPRMSLRARAIAVVVLLLGYWSVCLTPTPDGIPVQLWTQGRDLPAWLDRQVFGSWIYVKGPNGYDPEGLLSTVPAVAQALIGTIAGDFLRRNMSVPRLALCYALTGAAAVLLGLVWNVVLPIAKPLWTSSFVFVSAGLTLVGLGTLHYLCDRTTSIPPRGGPLGSFGRNAITAYAVHYIFIVFLVGAPLGALIQPLAPLVGVRWAALAPVAIFMVIIWAPLAIMDRRGWYWRI